MSDDNAQGQEALTGGDSGDQGATPASQDSAAATPISLSDDALVNIPGSQKPVKFGEWYRGFQSNATRTAQERSELQRRLETIERERQQEQAELSRYRQAQQGPDPRAQRGAERQQMLNKLKALPYLKGQEAADVVESINNELSQRDDLSNKQLMAIRLLAQELSKVQGTVQQLNTQHMTTGLQTRLSGVRTELGIPDSASEWLEELYLAYEPGPALDRDFPEIARKRWEQVIAAARQSDRQKVESARKGRFLPGKGGIGTPSKPLDMAGKSPKEQADLLWDMMKGTET